MSKHTTGSTEMKSYPTIPKSDIINNDDERLNPVCDRFPVEIPSTSLARRRDDDSSCLLPLQQQCQQQYSATSKVSAIIEDDLEFLASQKQSFSYPENQDLIAAELNKLSLQERETILHDLHGVSESICESQELVTRSLEELDTYLQPSTRVGTLPSSEHAAYQLAFRQNPAFVQDNQFRLLFLRSENFHVARAAQKLQQFLRIKLELFGKEKLCRTITLEDLDGEGDMECLRNGHIQRLNRRDTAGRAVVVIASEHIRFKVLENEVGSVTKKGILVRWSTLTWIWFYFFHIYMASTPQLKQMFYFSMALLEEKETQMNGIVMIAVGLPSQNPWTVWKVNQLQAAMPIRVRGWHVIHCSWGGRWLQWLSSLLPRQSRLRLRVHDTAGGGTHADSIHSLMTFGIPASGADFPIQVIKRNNKEESILSRENHWRWIEARRALEQQQHGQRETLRAKDSFAAWAIAHHSSSSTTDNGFLGLPPNSKTIQNRSNTALIKDRLPWHSDTNNINAQYLQQQQQQQQHDHPNDIVSIVFVPTSKDVLFGRGRPFQEHAGNVRFTTMLESLQEHYESLPRNEKTGFAQDIVVEMKSQGTRFLRQAAVVIAPAGSRSNVGNRNAGNFGWEQVNDAVAREKVSQAFRSMRSYGKKSSCPPGGTNGGGSSSGGTTIASDKNKAETIAAVATVECKSGGDETDLSGSKRRTTKENTGLPLMPFSLSSTMNEPNQDESTAAKRLRKA